MSLALARTGSVETVVCCDFSHEMLNRATRKFRRAAPPAVCHVIEGDGLRLPFASGVFDAVTVAFGVRNFHDLDAGLREIQRVVSPGGRLIVLEFSRPQGPLFGRIYRFYLRRVLPRIGDRISRQSGPYAYLARTIGDFPDPPTLAGRIREAGFAACGWTTRTGGIVAVHTAIKGY
jgi:demethylmenaquinone methyltransferase/2-methoxy-6-polyprenyl-1,4-benzoquinol methylase